MIVAALVVCAALQRCGSSTPTTPSVPPKPRATFSANCYAGMIYYGRGIQVGWGFQVFNTSDVAGTLTRVETFLGYKGSWYTGPMHSMGAYLAPHAEYKWQRMEQISDGPRYSDFKVKFFFTDANSYSATTEATSSVTWLN